MIPASGRDEEGAGRSGAGGGDVGSGVSVVFGVGNMPVIEVVLGQGAVESNEPRCHSQNTQRHNQNPAKVAKQSPKKRVEGILGVE